MAATGTMLGWLFFTACLLLSGTMAVRNLYMDSPTACNQRFTVADDAVIVKPRGTVGTANPPSTCMVHLESGYQGQNYKFEIVVEAAQFRDCNLELRIFDGPSAGGQYVRMLGCSSTESTGKLYPSARAVTLMLTRTRDNYFFGNDFSLRIQVYKSTDGPDEFLGTDKFPVGAIVGIILGIVVLVAFAILLGWCYKTGRIPGLDANDYPASKTASRDDLSRSQFDGFNSENKQFVSWHNTDNVSAVSDSHSNFNIDDSRILSSMTSTAVSTRKPNTRNTNNEPSGGRGYQANRGRDNQSTFNRSEPAQLSNSPNTRIRGRPPTGRGQRGPADYENNNFDKGELGLRGRRGQENYENLQKKNGLFENPDKEGYMYDYDQVQKLTSEGEGKRRGEGDSKGPGDGKDTDYKKQNTQNFESELKAAINRNSMKRQSDSDNSELDKVNFSTDPNGRKLDKNKQLNDSDLSSSAPNRTDGETTGPEAHSSPKPGKKKRKNSKEKKSPRSKRKTDDTKKSPKTKHKKAAEDEALPETFGSIFSGEDSDYEYPENQYQPGYQPGFVPPASYDPRYPPGSYPPGSYPPGSYPPGMPGFYPGMPPYQQAGQAQWYVENTPTGQQKVAFAMTTHSGSQDDNYGAGQHPGAPGYTSTPYNNSYPVSAAPGNSSALVPAGTILDDPQVPAPGTSLVRYDDDPNTGIKTSQVIWTDSKPDPTDPPPGENPQITRKTITRVTTRANEDDLPGAPNPSLQDMSFKTAQQIQQTGGQEPAFMSPTRGAPAPSYPHSAIQYARETPDRSNIGYYTGAGGQHIPGAPSPIIHDAPSRNRAIRDHVTMQDTSGETMA